MTKDLNKNIVDIQYNHLNLPCRIEFADGNHVSYLYDANGKKLRTTHIIGNDTTLTDYCDNLIYENGVAKTLLVEGGYISLSDGKYHFYIQDHQGNNRVVADENGNIEEVNHYYPFGGTFASSSGSVQSYKYNGKELNRKNGLDWYDYGARMYDVALGRWHMVDPMAEKYYSLTPYNYCTDSPNNLIDMDGMQADNPIIGTIELPEVTIIGKKIAEPISGFWNTIGYFFFGRTSSIPVFGSDNGNLTANPIGYITYNVNRAGVATSVAPIGGIGPAPARAGLNIKEIIKLLKAGKDISKTGLTAAGRALKKHGDRVGSAFPKAIGNQSAINQQGENVLKSILTNPNVEKIVNDGTLSAGRYGSDCIDYQIPGGIGARFSADGTKFIGFLEPRR